MNAARLGAILGKLSGCVVGYFIIRAFGESVFFTLCMCAAALIVSFLVHKIPPKQ